MVLEPDARAVEASRVQVPLVLVERLGDGGRADSDSDVVPGRVEELGAGEAGRVPAPVGDDHAPAAGPRAEKHVPGLNGLDSRQREVGFVRRRPGGDDDRVGRERGDGLGVGFRLEAHLDPGGLEQPTVVASERPRELDVHRRRPCQRDLAAEPAAALEQHDLVTCGPRLGGRCEARRPTTHDDHTPKEAARAGAPNVSSRPVRGFCAHAIGVPAW